MPSKLFKTKSPELLIRESEHPDRAMKRSLTAFDLTCLGIGAIIGAGIFALAGTAAAGESARVGESIVKTPVLNFIIAFFNQTDFVFGRPTAGPAVAARAASRASTAVSVPPAERAATACLIRCP